MLSFVEVACIMILLCELRECIVELQEANRRQEEERKKEKEDRIKYEKATSSIIEFLKGKDFTGVEPFGNGGSSSSC